MIVEYVRYNLKDHSAEQFIAGYRQAEGALRAAPECLGYDMTRCVDDDPNAFILRIRWTSKAEHLEGFRKGPHFAPFFKAIAPFVQEIAEMRHYAATGLEWSR